MEFDSWISNLRDVLQEQDSPLTLRNGCWAVADRKVHWETMSASLFDVHLDQFKDCIIEVLTELDPQFELPSEERYAASVQGKVLKHSSGLRKGLAETLALLGNHGEVLVNCSQDKAKSIAVLTIRGIFEKADWRLWGSLNNLLPILAEAEPAEFLSLVEKAMQQSPCPFDELFAQEGDGISGRNYMTGLLWALEGLSWSEEYLVRVAVILAELATLDPGGQWSNRPANSLITILLPWHPQTLAPIGKRIASIKAIRRDFSDVAWKILLSLLPNQHQSTSGAHKPCWRSVLPKDWTPNVTSKEYWEQVTGYAEIAVEMACEDVDKLKDLVINLDNLPKTSFVKILEYVSSSKITKLSETERLPIWTSLVDFAAKHRRFSDAKWALDEESISSIEVTASKLAPITPEGLYRRLFEGNDHDLYEERGDWKEQHKQLDEKRKMAIQEIIDVNGLDGVISFIDVVKSPDHIGRALASIHDSKFDSELLPKYLDVDESNYKQFISSFIWARYHHQGRQWVDGLDRVNWSLTQSCQFLMYLPFGSDAWDRVNKWLGRSDNIYWEQVMVQPYQTDSDLLPAIDKLLEVPRPLAAIDCLNYQLHEKLPFDRDQAVKALLDAVSVSEPVKSMDYYHITELIKALQDDPLTDQNDLFNIEWAYLSLLGEPHDRAQPKLLESRLAAEPEFFCEVIKTIYRSKKEEKQDEELNEQKKNIAVNAWQLLYKWKRPPGLNLDGSFSNEDFERWLNSVKDQCKESGHFEVAMIKVGEVLFYSPDDPQGLWIMQVVASALNARDAEDMRTGYRIEAANSRGVHWVDPTGKPERELAKQWRKKADDVENAGFARFAATLQGLAESYDREAERVVEEHKSDE